MKSFKSLINIYQYYFQSPLNATAYEEFASILELINHTDTSVYYREAGVIYIKFGLYDKALQMLDKSLYIQPDRCDIFYWKGKLYQLREDIESAISQFKRGIECDGIEAESSFRASVGELAGIYKDLKSLGDSSVDKDIKLLLNHPKVKNMKQ